MLHARWSRHGSKSTVATLRSLSSDGRAGLHDRWPESSELKAPDHVVGRWKFDQQCANIREWSIPSIFLTGSLSLHLFPFFLIFSSLLFFIFFFVLFFLSFSFLAGHSNSPARIPDVDIDADSIISRRHNAHTHLAIENGAKSTFSSSSSSFLNPKEIKMNKTIKKLSKMRYKRN